MPSVDILTAAWHLGQAARPLFHPLANSGRSSTAILILIVILILRQAIARNPSFVASFVGNFVDKARDKARDKDVTHLHQMSGRNDLITSEGRDYD